MVRPPCSDQKEHIRKGAWTSEEDERLINYIKHHGEGAWKSLPRPAGLLRCGKSCRLRWINYLRPHLKRGNFTKEEDELIINLQRVIGNKWSFIAAHLPGRTDNEIKNHWNTHIKRRLLDGGKHPQLPIRENNINSTIPSHQQPQIYPTFDVTKSDTDAPESDFSSSSSNNTVLFSTDQETNPEISLELSISLPQSHDAMKINDKFKLEKKWEFQYPQIFRRSISSIRSLSLSKESVCLCYNLRGYQNGYGTSSCTKCASTMTTNVDAANKFYRPLSLYGN